jgi:cytochrome b561
MTVANTRTRYGTVAMTLHWLIAAAVIFNICLGLYVADLPHGDPNQFSFLQFHKSVGLTVLVLSVARLVWRLINPVPPLPVSMNPSLRFLAQATHFLLYFLIVAIPLSGWIFVSASPLGLPTMYFGLFQWPHVPYFADLARADKNALRHTLHAVHTYLAWSAIFLVPLHIAGALYHQFVQRDDVLKRMLPGTHVPEHAA